MDTHRPRIAPVELPYPVEVAAELAKWMGPFPVEPLVLFRTLVRHPLLADRLRPLGSALLNKLRLPAAERELVILRVCARRGAEYEWGVHAAGFAQAVGLSEAVVRATVSGEEAAFDARQRLLLRFVDALDAGGHVEEELWREVAQAYSEGELIELMVLAGFYQMISTVVNAMRLPVEPWAWRWR